jgi:hypothetical protein
MLSSRRQIYDLYNNHVLNYATATLDRFSLRRKFPRLHFGLSYPMEYGFTMLYAPTYWKDGIQTQNMPTVRSQLRLCTMRSDLKSTKYSKWPSTPTALNFCSKFVGRHLSTYLARTLGSPCEESTTYSFKHIFRISSNGCLSRIFCDP